MSDSPPRSATQPAPPPPRLDLHPDFNFDFDRSNRPPTLSFPTLHLGSFSSLSPNSFSPTAPGSASGSGSGKHSPTTTLTGRKENRLDRDANADVALDLDFPFGVTGGSGSTSGWDDAASAARERERSREVQAAEAGGARTGTRTGTMGEGHDARADARGESLGSDMGGAGVGASMSMSMGPDSARPGSSRSRDSSRPVVTDERPSSSSGRPAGAPAPTLNIVSSRSPPTMSLPPLPSISPISPLHPPSSGLSQDAETPAAAHGASGSTSWPASTSSGSFRPSPATLSALSPAGPRDLPQPSRSRSIGGSLTINIPGAPLSSERGPGSAPGPGSGSSPILKTSPGIPRRRTVIESNHPASRTAPVRMSAVIDSLGFVPPQEQDGMEDAAPPEGGDLGSGSGSGLGSTTSPKTAARKKSLEQLTLTMPVARPTPGRGPTIGPQESVSPAKAERRLPVNGGDGIDGIDVNVNVDGSPTSPTPKRSLPRPPKEQSTPTPTPQSNRRPSPSPSASTLPLPLPAAPFAAALAGPSQPSSSIVTQAHVRTPKTPETQNRSDRSLRPAKHQPTNSASTLPVIAGLADAGPYPSTSPNLSRSGGPPGVGVGPGMGVNVGLGRAPKQPPPEEVCLECMMRDRDLADVIVQGSGVWERESDVAFEELRWREDAIVKSVGSPGNGTGNGTRVRSDSRMSVSTYAPSKLSSSHSVEVESSSDESAAMSLTSGGASMEDAEGRKRAVMRRRKKDEARRRRREADGRVINEVGWRGFKWEEGTAGEGLPRGFRGGKGGLLTEDGIKAVMAKFPSASALRYSNLQTYLRHQYHLVLDIAAEAKRIGHYPTPEETRYADEGTSMGSAFAGAGAGSRSSSLMWDHSTSVPTAESSRAGPYTPASVPPPNISLVRPSPSSPADLVKAGRDRVKPPPLQRPLTHFIPDREPAPSVSRAPLQDVSPVSNGAAPRARHGKGISSPGVMQSSPQLGEAFDAEEDLYSPISPAESGMRPFSFAVRAGAAAAREGSEGHGRRSLFGRWGGSVTSFFGGSQGGSGSMVDMHLGLDNDRRYHAASNNVHSYPRAVSLASPTRPSFFSRDSRDSRSVSGDRDRERDSRLTKSISASRLSQSLSIDDDDEPKKKGLKGLWKKMRPKSRKSSKSSLPVPRHFENANAANASAASSDLGAPLAPPPPLSFLVGRGDRRHDRNRSGSSSSMLTDSQTSISIAPGAPGQRRESYGYPGGRSVSAPLAGSSSGGSQSVSPTSSRFNATNGARRESYASMSGRRLSATLVEDDAVYPGYSNRRTSLVEVLSGKPGYNTADPSYLTSNDERPLQLSHPSAPAAAASYPVPNWRPHNKTTSSFSASSGMIETPPANQHTAFFTNPNQPASGGGGGGAIVKSSSTNLSPNRFKNLPPLPPGQANGANGGAERERERERETRQRISASPEMFTGAFTDAPDQYVSDRDREVDRDWSSSGSPQMQLGPGFKATQPTQPRMYPTPQAHAQAQTPRFHPQPRGSIDRLARTSFDALARPPRKSYDPNLGSGNSISNSNPNPNSMSYPGTPNRPREPNTPSGSPRMAKSMYAQSSFSGSTASFGRMPASGPGSAPGPGGPGGWANANEGYGQAIGRGYPAGIGSYDQGQGRAQGYGGGGGGGAGGGGGGGYPNDPSDGRSVKGKKGIKKWFGGSKAGRLA